MRPCTRLLPVVIALAVLAACSGVDPVDPEPAWEAPQLEIAFPASDGEVLSGEVTLTGSAASEVGVFKVELQLDEGQRVQAVGREEWSFPLDTRRLDQGTHTVTAWVTDRKGQSASAMRTFEVRNAAAPAELVASAVQLSDAEVSTWDRFRAEVTLSSTGAGTAELADVALKAWPEDAEGPVLTLGEPVAEVRLAPGETLTLRGEHIFNPLEPLGSWKVALTWRDAVTGDVHETPAETVVVRRELLLGAALHNGRLFNASEPLYAETFVEHFDALTPEFEMKWAQIQPQEGVYDFSVVDRMVAFAETRGKRVRGHVLAWHKSLPGWITSRSWTREQAIALLEDYVAVVMGRYKGRINEWDIVNEAFLNDGNWRTGMWFDTIGPDYIEIAFRAAHRADPAARLFYNDYDAERVNAKSTKILETLTALRQAGVPIHGVGFQGHVSFNYYPTEQQLAQNFTRFHGAGFVTYISELDVRTSSRPDLTVAERLQLQADVYRGIARACSTLPGCTGLTTWGITDKYTWLTTQEMPLPFDANYQRKPAFDALEQAFGRDVP